MKSALLVLLPVLLALAGAARTGLTATDQPKIHQAFRYYRHRFRYRRDFGQVSWLALAEIPLVPFIKEHKKRLGAVHLRD